MHHGNTILLVQFVTAALLLLTHRGASVIAELVEQHFGGRTIDFNEYNWFAALRRLGDNAFFCSGALIGVHHVITAYHCVENKQSADVVVQVGYYCIDSNNCFRDSFYSRVTRWYHHEGGGDFALVELTKAMAVQPAVPYLGSPIHPRQSFMKNKKKGRNLVMVGAGRTGRDEDMSFYVRKLDVTYLAPEQCHFPNPSLLTDHVVCSIPINGSPCAGDSGSALVVPGKEQFVDRDVVMAVHNFGPRQCEDPEHNVIGHFPLEDAADLIQEVVCDGVSPAVWCPKKVEASILHTMTGHEISVGVGSLSFNFNGTRLISGGYDGRVMIWDPIGGGNALMTFGNASGPRVYAPQFHPLDDNYFAFGSGDDSVQLWRTDTAVEPLYSFQGHNGIVASVSWNPSGALLASGSWDGKVKIWSLNFFKERLITTLTGHKDDVRSVSFNRAGTQLASASVDSTIKLWDAASTSDNFPLLRTLKKHAATVWRAVYSPDGQLLASGSADATTKVWNVTSGKVEHDFDEHDSDVFDVAWSPSGRLLATGSRDGTVRVWDVWNGGPSVLVLEPPLGDAGAQVTSLAWSPDGTLVACGYSQGGKIIVRRIIHTAQELDKPSSCRA